MSQPGAETPDVGNPGGSEPAAETPTVGETAEVAAPAAEGEAFARRPRDWLRARRDLPRRSLIAVVAIVLVLFLALSGLLARFLSTENVERDEVLAVLRAEAAGDERGMLSRLSGCRARPSCLATVRADAASLRRAGAVKILDLTSATAYSLSGATGVTRVAWTVIGHLPTVQCVTVERSGNFLTGVNVALLSIGGPIESEADC